MQVTEIDFLVELTFNFYSKLFSYSLSLTSLNSLPCDLLRCIMGNSAFLVSLTLGGHCLPIPIISPESSDPVNPIKCHDTSFFKFPSPMFHSSRFEHSLLFRKITGYPAGNSIIDPSLWFLMSCF